jgi:photosystem II stability/assembly factor-like uncharacterized protein
LASIFFVDSNTGYTVGENGLILKTLNGGTTWTIQPSGTTNELSSVYFTDTETGYIVDLEGTIRKTTNGGTSWTSLNSENANELWSVYFPDANKGYTVGEYGTILITTNGGTHWTNQTSGTLKSLYSVYFTDANTGYAVGDSGTILKTTNGGYPLGVKEVSSNSANLKIYPSISSDKITIETRETPASNKLSILNPNGQQLITRPITEPRSVVDISNLPNGVYFVRLTNEKAVEVGKFIKE